MNGGSKPPEKWAFRPLFFVFEPVVAVNERKRVVHYWAGIPTQPVGRVKLGR
jgi:hypothetical protein